MLLIRVLCANKGEQRDTRYTECLTMTYTLCLTSFVKRSQSCGCFAANSGPDPSTIGNHVRSREKVRTAGSAISGCFCFSRPPLFPPHETWFSERHAWLLSTWSAANKRTGSSWRARLTFVHYGSARCPAWNFLIKREVSWELSQREGGYARSGQ